MNINILKSEKEELEIELDNATIAEILREYLNKDENVRMAAWRKEHPDKNAVLVVKTKGKTAKKAVADAISLIEKESTKLLEGFKKSK